MSAGGSSASVGRSRQPLANRSRSDSGSGNLPFPDIALAGTVLVEESREPQVGNEWRVEVTDDRGLILYRLDIGIAQSPAVPKRRG